jgi:SAM-dependent methyltransferase
MVAGFADAPPNPTLMRFAQLERQTRAGIRALDIGCGAGRNAVPLAAAGWDVLGLDNSEPMLQAAAGRQAETEPGRLALAAARMDALPVAPRAVDFIVAQGIWNLAASGAEFRQAVREAARVARAGAALFVFTFSRHTLGADAPPVDGETFVFTGFSGHPQCFLTAQQLVDELACAGFAPDPAVPLTELNRPKPGSVRTGGPPVIYEGAFRYISTS